MTPLAHLLLVACALVAPLHAASIPETPSVLHKNIPAVLLEEAKKPLEINTGHELSDLHEPVKQIDNELRVKPAEEIPVAVLVENVEPSVQINEVVDDNETKRPELDLKNPGPPQRQEHETQNPEQHSDEQLKASTLKKSIEETQNLLRQSFQDVTNDIQNWFPNFEGRIKIQQNIQNLRDTFTSQIQKLNDTIQVLVKPEDSKPAESQAEESQADFQKIESRLKLLTDNFNNGVQTLSAGVDLVANLKSSVDNDEAAREEAPEAAAVPALPPPAALPAPAAVPPPVAQPPSAAAPAPATPPNFLVQMVNLIYNATMTNVNRLQNMLTPSSSSPPSNEQSNVQADTPDSSVTPRPPWAPLTDLFNRPQNIQWPTFPPTFGQNFTLPPQWNLEALGNILNPFGTTTKPPESTNNSPGDKPEESKPDPNTNKPAEAAVSTPVEQPSAVPVPQPGGPIRQFLTNNPITQGIVGTVQRIQNSITNTDTPRDPVVKSDSLKGGWYGKPGHGGGSGNNNDGGGLSGKKVDEIKEPIQEESKKEEVAEVKPEVVSEKTE